jgi:UDP-2,4-diacetamido-2,4,6-trideoxy-beta-L-altropyranose hydrolase
MKPGALLIRADASVAIGTGHMMRCLALAHAWRDAGGQASFAVGEMPDALAGRFVSECGELLRVVAIPGSAKDAEETAAHARRLRAQWVVVDGDRFRSEFLTILQAGGSRLALVDDFADRESFPADLIVNPNSGVDEKTYRQRAYSGPLLAGERCVLLRREFRKSIERVEFQEQEPRVLVTLGGSDPENLAPRIAAALMAWPGLQVTVVAGPGYGKFSDLQKMKSNNLRVVQNSPNIEELMRNSDLAVIAAGGTLWELLALGCVVLSYSRNSVQARVVTDLASRGMVVDMGETRSFEPEKLLSAIRGLVSSPGRCQQMAKLSQGLVDGLGATRVVEEMLRSGARN